MSIIDTKRELEKGVRHRISTAMERCSGHDKVDFNIQRINCNDIMRASLDNLFQIRTVRCSRIPLGNWSLKSLPLSSWLWSGFVSKLNRFLSIDSKISTMSLSVERDQFQGVFLAAFLCGWSTCSFGGSLCLVWFPHDDALKRLISIKLQTVQIICCYV